jgi:phosphoribosylformimino-5-aminoimidazole carboxamide ribotide isomerase
MKICRVVPAIDLIAGKCVRLEQGDFSKGTTVAEDPLEMALTFERQGFSRLHLVDLDGAKSGCPRHLDLLESIASNTTLSIDYSGGLRSEESIADALRRGATQVILGSAAVLDPTACCQWLATFGGERIILGLDVLHGRLRVKGWQEEVGISLEEVIERYLSCGLTSVMTTDISKDGMRAGPGFDLYRRLVDRYPTLRIIASGGVTTVSDITQLADLGVSEVIVGKGLYSGDITAAQLGELLW